MRTTRVAANHPSIPTQSPTILRWFLWYMRRYLRRHVNAVRVTGLENAIEFDGPLIVCLNHASWWDPLVCAFLADTLFPARRHFAPIDDKALQRYSFFSKLGFFGVEKESHRGARAFFEVSSQILQQPQATLWITGQGRFADVRERPFQLMPGIEHLVARTPQCRVLPIAIEITYWEESRPEVLVRLGEAIPSSNVRNQLADLPLALTSAMENVLDQLAVDSIARNHHAFRILLGGKAGVGGIYDRWRSLKAFLSGRRFDPRHSREVL